MRAFALFAIVAVASFAAEPATWWVSPDGVDAEGYGVSSNSPFATLQYAHDAASAGDTVNVLPGVYDKGVSVDASSYNKHTNRLTVSKLLYFNGVGGKDATHIVGAFDSDTGEDGPSAVRGICVNAGGRGSQFRNFTIRGCAADGTGTNDRSDGESINFGGGALVYGSGDTSYSSKSPAYKAYFIDCVFSNNVAKWGAAMRGGTAIRCLLADNRGNSYGQTACSAALWNCVVRGSVSRIVNPSTTTERPTLGNKVLAVNTAIFGCEGYGAMRGCTLLNCAFNLQGNTAIYSPSWGETTTYGSITAEKCVTDTDGVLMFAAPAAGDFRPLSGGPAAGAGLTEYLKEAVVLPNGVEMTDYNGNKLTFDSATCDIGPVQGAVQPVGGGLWFPNPVSIDGVYNRRPSYVFADVWPRQFRAVPMLLSGEFMRYRRTPDGHFLYLQYDGGVWLMPPADAGLIYTNTAVIADQVLWADANADPDDDAEANGSSLKPFRTLQAAMDAVTANPKATIIYARPGDYDDGGAEAYSHSNRVYFGNAAILLKSTGGAAVTAIVGAADSNGAYPENYPGCGPASMRCIAGRATNNSAVQGFTIRDGHGGVAENSYLSDMESDRGGGIIGSLTYNLQVLDCVVTNCTAVRGAATYGAWFSRCKFADCIAYGGVFRYAHLASCEVAPTCRGGTGAANASYTPVLGHGTRTYFSTIPSADIYPGVMYYNTLFGDQGVTASRFYGSVFRSPASIAADASGYVTADPYFADEASGDYRIPAWSPARHAGTLPKRGTAEWNDYATAMTMFVGGDIAGNPLDLGGNAPTPGAYHAFAPCILLTDMSGSVRVTGATLSPTGFSKVTEGADVTVVQNTSATRPAIGFSINGVTNFFATIDGRAHVIPFSDIAESGVVITPVYTTEWFVDAVFGNDVDNDGCTVDTPKKTLARVLAATVSGDTVHAAAGDYTEGSMLHASANPATSPASRAVIPSGVTLVAEKGPKCTFITGALATSSDADVYCRGSNGVRCVYMNVGSVLRGFTLRGGRVRCLPAGEAFNSYSSSLDWLGGGVYGAGRASAADVASTRVENCTVSNCIALVGGAGTGVTFDGCRLFGCRAMRGSATERAGLLNTVVDDMDSEGGSGHCVNDAYACVNVTIGRNVRKDTGDGKGIGLFRQWAYDYGVTNTVLLSATSLITNAVNSVFLSTDASVNVSLATMINCRKHTIEQMALNDRYAPDRASSVLVDSGVSIGMGGLDALGGQRVYNGCIDIGAVEADWRGRYATILGALALNVDSASPEVVEHDGAVCITNGSVCTTFVNRQSPKRTVLLARVAVTGSGVLHVMLDGNEFDSISATDGEMVLQIPIDSAVAALDFTYESGDEDAGCAVLRRFSTRSGFAVFMR